MFGFGKSKPRKRFQADGLKQAAKAKPEKYKPNKHKPAKDALSGNVTARKGAGTAAPARRQKTKVGASPLAPEVTSDFQRAAFVQKRGREIEIYVHVPFCVQKCLYCDFLSAPAESERQVRIYMEDLRREVELIAADILLAETGNAFADRVTAYEVRSIFFGGGTPSIVPASMLTAVLDQIRTSFVVKEDAEITLEANPGTLTEENLRAYRAAGINRLSIGVQSCNDVMLKKLGRIHTFAEARAAFEMARAAGFTNISVDLMSGLPHQSLEIWRDTLRQIIAWNPEHISAYSLIVEDGTPYADLYRGEGEKNLPNEDTEREMYYLTDEMLTEAGYHRYEISNYAKPGRECIHNLGYWTGVDYLGLGLGASSLWDRTRYQNVRDHGTYHTAVNAGDINSLHTDVQKLSRNECMEEHMFLGLRCMEGISKKEFEDKFGVTYETVCGPATARLLKQGLIEVVDGDRIRLTKLGIDVSNRVFAEFLIDE